MLLSLGPGLLSLLAVRAQDSSRLQVCNTVVGVLSTTFVYKQSMTQLAHVEVRQCNDGSESIQIAAWREGQSSPALVINTDDFGVVQYVARANVYLIETGGATRDQVFTIVYEHGIPTLRLRRTTKGTALVRMEPTSMNVVIGGIYAGDGAGKQEEYRFLLDPRASRPD